MIVGLLSALLAALLTGSATVLQAVGARRAATAGPETRPEAGPEARPAPEAGEAAALAGALRQWPFLVGVGMDMCGFAAELVALERLPLYAVEAALASALAVTAVGAARVLRVRLRGSEWAGVAAVCAGLCLLALTAGRDGRGTGDDALRLGVLLVAVGLLGAGWAAVRYGRARRAPLLGFVAGLQFGVVGVAVRVLPEPRLPDLLAEPSAYAVAVAGLGGFAALTWAMQHGSVTSATAAMVLGETVGPAVVGVLVLGDHTRHDLAPLAVLGFVAAVAGALTLARFGDAEQPAVTA
ncbi:hypothetical protein BX285_6137 [Streptomyces sp. 1114.5]|uniref:hypothetical protein n=1 Tax=Streptomyces sp. 1114.5 TaxID=1938830 RepID=UPI000F135AD0|nr:hypothetical protein [Streptomyces sp. 1114.5]RKT12171.1 hypothetical protein BX285_6137 [Streptomyces sp. 1114.5]